MEKPKQDKPSHTSCTVARARYRVDPASIFLLSHRSTVVIYSYSSTFRQPFLSGTGHTAKHQSRKSEKAIIGRAALGFISKGLLLPPGGGGGSQSQTTNNEEQKTKNKEWVEIEVRRGREREREKERS